MQSDVLASLGEFEVDYRHDVDRNWGREAHLFYAKDGVFIIGDRTMAGRKALPSWADLGSELRFQR